MPHVGHACIRAGLLHVSRFMARLTSRARCSDDARNRTDATGMPLVDIPRELLLSHAALHTDRFRF